MIDDNKHNPPLHYYKSDYEKVREKLLFWRAVSVTLGIFTVGLMILLLNRI